MKMFLLPLPPSRPVSGFAPRRGRLKRLVCALLGFAAAGIFYAQAESPAPAPEEVGVDLARSLVAYFEQMSVPKPFAIRQGQVFTDHQAALRRRIIECIGLSPLPERVPLDLRATEAIHHPWCTIQRVYYQLWPGVYASGLLYLPKAPAERTAPAVLCPHGHWTDGNANPVVQARCLMLAKLGYIAFSPNQNHYEDLNLGISHQTLGVWSNMRALDSLETRPDVDRTRLGACGASGGGLQTQMLTALDPRVKAAAIVGMTCQFREIIFPAGGPLRLQPFSGHHALHDAPGDQRARPARAGAILDHERLDPPLRERRFS